MERSIQRECKKKEVSTVELQLGAYRAPGLFLHETVDKLHNAHNLYLK